MVIHSAFTNISVQSRKAPVPAEAGTNAGIRQSPSQQPEGAGERLRSGEISSTNSVVSRPVPSPHAPLTIDLRVLHRDVDALPNRKAISTYHAINALTEQGALKVRQGLDLLV